MPLIVLAGNPPDLTASCAASLLEIDEGSAGHEEYPLYYTTAAQRRRAREMFQIDIAAFNYTFDDVEGPYTLAYLH